MDSDRGVITLDDDRAGADIVTPPYITIPQAARSLPSGRKGQPTHSATITRWITGGSKGPDGEIIRLKAVRLGGRWLTTRRWLDEFAERLTPDFSEVAAESA
jgi:hypothetical protein